ncbi:MAG: phosphoribosylglycinamide formyltransferase [Deltaproteobacteria bacterium]|nr:phosphoribosylglycinamide formyltransferase [Deltaproteobacteria bacterium]MBK8237838.1 phosphoribosylglycinamide formyltransferase [Deltaproteobacteria bacterium]MBK8720656.1 phosphoribosylglycinamide formyltransferase [Deltaproteobacteria bacterium]MBP7290779.1 phosphoribosylglycinamide formyltransferase [Nannocystaceae bacterium]
MSTRAPSDAAPAAPAPTARLRLGVLASGRGSNLEALQAAIDRGQLAAEVALVVSNNSSAGALAFARSRDIACAHVSRRTDADEGAALLQHLLDARVDVVVLAGYMKLLDPRVVAAYRGRAVNIHPGPLPRFGGPGMFGAHVHAAVLAAGVTHSGPTVHLVDEAYDEGAVLAHTPVAIEPGDTAEGLAARVLAAEHALYWRAIADHFDAHAKA